MFHVNMIDYETNDGQPGGGELVHGISDDPAMSGSGFDDQDGAVGSGGQLQSICRRQNRRSIHNNEIKFLFQTPDQISGPFRPCQFRRVGVFCPAGHQVQVVDTSRDNGPVNSIFYKNSPAVYRREFFEKRFEIHRLIRIFFCSRLVRGELKPAGFHSKGGCKSLDGVNGPDISKVIF